jgi:colicin import membrane protein
MARKTPTQWQALLFTVGLHAAFILVVYLASVWVFIPEDKPSTGEPVQATLSFSADDIAKARKSIRKAELDAKSAEALPQPLPSPKPQTADQELQDTAQAWIDDPQQEVQEAVNKNAPQPSAKTREQELKQKQGQVELTEDVKKDVAEENRQRLNAQIEAVKKARAEAARQAQLEEQRLDELAGSTGNKAPNKTPAEPPSGQRGVDDALRNKYKSALNATARSNWNTVQIPEQTRCQVEFTQIRGGEVIDVRFLACPLDASGRESVERALYKSPMPFAGFEAVFQRKVILTFCYPDEVCQ